jgi:hypothetical protein
MIAKYWFEKSAPIDEFDVSNGMLTFTDWAVKFGFHPAEGAVYQADVFAKRGRKLEKIDTVQTTAPSIDFRGWLAQGENIILRIGVDRSAARNRSGSVWVELNVQGIVQIARQD